MTALLSLAARVEQLTGRCRETDGDIANALALYPSGWRRGVAEASATAIWFNDKTGQSWSAPSFTASLDLAMTLVPEGIWYCLSGPHSESGGRYKGGAQRFDITMGIGEDRADSRAASAPNATIAAALRFRARAALEGSHG